MFLDKLKLSRQILKFSLEKFQVCVFAQTWIRCVICHVSFSLAGNLHRLRAKCSHFFFLGGGALSDLCKTQKQEDNLNVI